MLASSGATANPSSTPPDWSLLAPLAEESLLLDITPSGEAWIAVGERGHVLVSEDDGESWIQSPVPTRRTLCAVTGRDDGQAWAVGHDSVILYSQDHGRSWTVQYAAPEEETPLFDVWFEDAVRGLAVGAYGTALETFDGGRTWEPTSLTDDDPHFYSIAASGAGVLYVAGEFGTVLRSEDGGETWILCETPYGGSYFGIEALDDETVLVFGLRGRLYRSSDRGDTWTQIDVDSTAALLAATQRGDGSVLVVGLSGCILVSEDRGETVRVESRADRVAMTTVMETRGRVLVLGEDGVTSWPLPETP